MKKTHRFSNRFFTRRSTGRRAQAPSKGYFGFAAAGASLAAFAAQAHGQTTIIQDNFTSGSQYGTVMGYESADSQPGLSPDTVDLPGGPWQHISGAYYDGTEHSGNLNGVNGQHVYTPVDLAAFH